MARRLQSGPSRARLIVSGVLSVAEAWFLPNLAARHRLAAGPMIDLRVQQDPVDFAGEDIDIRLCYGENMYPDMLTVPLFRDSVIPLAAPGLVPKAGLDLRVIPDRMLIHTNWGAEFASNPGWTDWLGRYLPDRRPDTRTGHRAGTSFTALDMARRGTGVALGQRHLAHHLVQAGDLMALSDADLPLGHGYAAVIPYSKVRRASLKEVLDWLVGISSREPDPEK